MCKGVKTFDLNICRLAFLYSYNKNDLDFYHNINKYLKDYDLDMIINRKMYIYMLLYRPNIFSRIIKYINRGFEFITVIFRKIIQFLVLNNAKHCTRLQII